MNFLKGRQKKLKLFMIGLFSVLGFLMLVNLFVGKLFFTNVTNSAPRGIYLVSIDQNLHYEDYVIASLPVDVSKLHVEKGFLLLKQIRGFPGDVYTVSDHALVIRGESYKIFQQEGLPEVEAGEKQIPEEEILLLNDMERSFDSRYLGPIYNVLIVKKVDLLLSYEPFICFIEKVMPNGNS